MYVRPIDSWPELRAPFMVVALQGWVDAGSSAQLAAASLRQGWGLRRIALYDTDHYLDYQHRRPQIRLDEDSRRRIEWQEIEFLSGSSGPRDCILLTGPEPARHWRSFLDATVDVATRLRVQQIYMLGALPSPVPHSRPVPVAGTVSNDSLTGHFSTLLGSYEGPTGMQTALQVSMGGAGIPAESLWAQVPHYLAAMVWPGGAVSLLRKLGTETGTRPVIDDLVSADVERRRQVDEAITERPDVQALVSALEEGAQVEDVPSGDELADEIERFLAAQGDEAGE